jgi:hypothetical protein
MNHPGEYPCRRTMARRQPDIMGYHTTAESELLGLRDITPAHRMFAPTDLTLPRTCSCSRGDRRATPT